MLHKAGQEKHGKHSSFLRDGLMTTRKSLSEIGWTEEHIMLFGRIALENHSYVATRAERSRNSEH